LQRVNLLILRVSDVFCAPGFVTANQDDSVHEVYSVKHEVSVPILLETDRQTDVTERITTAAFAGGNIARDLSMCALCKMRCAIFKFLT